MQEDCGEKTATSLNRSARYNDSAHAPADAHGILLILSVSCPPPQAHNNHRPLLSVKPRRGMQPAGRGPIAAAAGPGTAVASNSQQRSYVGDDDSGYNGQDRPGTAHLSTRPLLSSEPYGLRRIDSLAGREIRLSAAACAVATNCTIALNMMQQSPTVSRIQAIAQVPRRHVRPHLHG